MSRRILTNTYLSYTNSNILPTKFLYVILSPSTHEAHEEGTKEHQQAGNHAAFTPEMAPALVAEEIFREQLDQGCKREQAGGNGVHDSDEDEADFRVRAVKSVRCETNCLSDWGSAIFLLVSWSM